MPEIQSRRRPNHGVGGNFILCLTKLQLGDEVGDHLGLFQKRQIRGAYDSGFLRWFGSDIEEEFGSQVGHRHIARFVNSDQIVALPSSLYGAQLQLLLGLKQFVDQGGGSGEAHSSLLPAGSHAQTGQQIRLARSSSPTQIDGENSGV